MTRRATRPFVPSQAPNYWSLQRQVQQMEDEPPKPVSKPLRYVARSASKLVLFELWVRNTITEDLLTDLNSPDGKITTLVHEKLVTRAF